MPQNQKVQKQVKKRVDKEKLPQKNTKKKINSTNKNLQYNRTEGQNVFKQKLNQLDEEIMWNQRDLLQTNSQPKIKTLGNNSYSQKKMRNRKNKDF